MRDLSFDRGDVSVQVVHDLAELLRSHARNLDPGRQVSDTAGDLVDVFSVVASAYEGLRRWDGRVVHGPDGQTAGTVRIVSMPTVMKIRVGDVAIRCSWLGLSAAWLVMVLAGLLSLLIPSLPAAPIMVLSGLLAAAANWIVTQRDIQRRDARLLDRGPLRALTDSEALLGAAGAEPTVGGLLAEAQHLLDDLELAWVQYRTDPHDYCLERPLLHEDDVPRTAAYRQALFTAKEMLATLDAESATLGEAREVLSAAEAAWSAWNEASRHATEVGLDPFTSQERAALRRISQLVVSIGDASVPKPERDRAADALFVQLRKLTRPLPIQDLAQMPALQSLASAPGLAARSRVGD